MELHLNKPLFLELEGYERNGVRICIRETPASPYQVVKAFAEKPRSQSFMRDYVPREDGTIGELHFYPLNE